MTIRGVWVRACLAVVLCVTGTAFPQIYLPDPQLSPGAINPDVSQQNIGQTVCIGGWTATVRPPSSYIAKLKLEQMRALNLPGAPRDYHEDHRIPLCAGGHPSDPRNLWPQPIEGQWRDADKNQLEGSVCRQLCRGDIDLEQARGYFFEPDWTKVYGWFFERSDH